MGDSEIESRLNELREKGKEHAKAESERCYLEDFKKAKLATLMKEAENAGFKTVSAQEREAYASQDYANLLNGLKVATDRSIRLKWEIESIRAALSVWQTSMANQRAEAGFYKRG